MHKIETFVDEGFRVSLIETAFFISMLQTYSNELLGEKVAFQGVDKNSMVPIVSNY